MRWRALLAFLALPGVVAYAAPVFLESLWGHRAAPWRVGVVPIGAGTLLLLWCVREFYVVGRGTLAPWAPPQRLVTSGPYQYSRNPMYIAVVTVLVGWAVYFRSSTLMCYALVAVVAFHLRIVLKEEPWALGMFASAWVAYRARVPRWFKWPGA